MAEASDRTGETADADPGDEPTAPGAPQRRGFALVALVGLAAGVLAAVAGNHAWADVPDTSTTSASFASVGAAIDQANAPLVTSLALVALAVWGVVLVSRRLFRRLVAGLGALVGLGLVAGAVGAFVEAPRQVRDAVLPETPHVSHTSWSYVGVASAVVTLASLVVALARVGRWPEMGRRYDAPAGAEPAPVVAEPIEERTNLDLWRDIDEGRDPTERH